MAIESNTPASDSIKATQTRIQRSDAQKAEILAALSAHGIAHVQKEYGVSPSVVYKWRDKDTANPKPTTSREPVAATPVASKMALRQPMSMQVRRLSPEAGASNPSPSVQATANAIIAKGKEEIASMEAMIGRLTLENYKLKEELTVMKANHQRA
jgi:transposase-like protein